MMKRRDTATLMLYAKKNTLRMLVMEPFPLLKRRPSELIYCLQKLEIQFINICFCRDSYTTHTNLINFCV